MRSRLTVYPIDWPRRQELITWWGVDTKQLQLTITDIRAIDSDKWGITLQMAMLEGQQSDDMVEVCRLIAPTTAIEYLHSK